MRIVTEPEIYIVGRQTLNSDEVQRFLKDHETYWDTDSENGAELIVELGHFTDVALIACQIRRDCRHDPGRRRTTDLQDEMVLLVLHGQSSERWRQLGEAKMFRGENCFDG